MFNWVLNTPLKLHDKIHAKHPWSASCLANVLGKITSLLKLNFYVSDLHKVFNVEWKDVVFTKCWVEWIVLKYCSVRNSIMSVIMAIFKNLILINILTFNSVPVAQLPALLANLNVSYCHRV